LDTLLPRGTSESGEGPGMRDEIGSRRVEVYWTKDRVEYDTLLRR
jgi:hypothetical protein